MGTVARMGRVRMRLIEYKHIEHDYLLQIVYQESKTVQIYSIRETILFLYRMRQTNSMKEIESSLTPQPAPGRA